MMMNKSEWRLLLAIAALLLTFFWSLISLMQLRSNIKGLSKEAVTLFSATKSLHNMQNELRLEYASLLDYASIRQEAIELGMEDPQIEKGTWMYLFEGSDQ